MVQDILNSQERFTENQLAEYWGINKTTLQKWRSIGCGPIYIKIGGKVLYPKAAILEYEQNRVFQGTGERIFTK